MKFEMAEIQVEKFALVDVITTSGETVAPPRCENETPPQQGEWD